MFIFKFCIRFEFCISLVFQVCYFKLLVLVLSFFPFVSNLSLSHLSILSSVFLCLFTSFLPSHVPVSTWSLCVVSVNTFVVLALCFLLSCSHVHLFVFRPFVSPVCKRLCVCSQSQCQRHVLVLSVSVCVSVTSCLLLSLVSCACDVLFCFPCLVSYDSFKLCSPGVSAFLNHPPVCILFASPSVHHHILPHCVCEFSLFVNSACCWSVVSQLDPSMLCYSLAFSPIAFCASNKAVVSSFICRSLHDNTGEFLRAHQLLIRHVFL